jgi:hypothetical protein
MGGVHLGQLQARGSAEGRVALALGAALIAVSAAARAQPQSAAPLVPIVTPLRGDDVFAGKHGLSAYSAFTPLRLTLSGGLFSQANAFSGCDARSDASGNSVNGFAVQRYTFLRLAPQLVLHGSSMAGCAVDAGMGGGLTYTLPLRKNLWLVSSAGFYALPSPGGGSYALVTKGVRVDVVKQLAWGRTLSVGLGSRLDSGVFNALNFGGSF